MFVYVESSGFISVFVLFFVGLSKRYFKFWLNAEFFELLHLCFIRCKKRSCLKEKKKVYNHSNLGFYLGIEKRGYFPKQSRISRKLNLR